MRFFLFFTAMATCLAVGQAAICSVSTSECSGDIPAQTAKYVDESLRTFVSELPTDELGECVLGAHGEMISGGISLQLKLVCEGKETLEETRIVTSASAAAQARTMARNLLETHFASPSVKRPTVKIDSLELVVLETRYNRRVALGLSMWLTIAPLAVGAVGIVLGFQFNRCLPENGPLIASGIVLASNGLVFGPSAGYFYLGRHAHGWLWAAGRLVMGGATAVFFRYGWGKGMAEGEYYHNFCDGEEDAPSDCEGSDTDRVFYGLGFASATITLTLTLIDAGLVGKAADKMNLSHRQQNKPTLVVAPTPIRTPSGRTVPGLTMALTF